jgi:hypothetical protein
VATRYEFYRNLYGSRTVWRTARLSHRCNAPLCLTRIQPGNRYLDTGEALKVTRRLCEACANGTC